MVKFVVKGLNYTKIETENTVQFWRLQKERKESQCGVWIDGLKVNDFSMLEAKKVSGQFHLVNIHQRRRKHE